MCVCVCVVKRRCRTTLCRTQVEGSSKSDELVLVIIMNLYEKSTLFWPRSSIILMNERSISHDVLTLEWQRYLLQQRPPSRARATHSQVS